MSYSEKVYSTATHSILLNDEDPSWVDFCDADGCDGVLRHQEGTIYAVCDRNDRHSLRTECCEECAGLTG